MITLRDCLGLCDALPEEVAVVADHEHLPDLLAAEKAHAVLQADWGGPAMRQMIRDQAHIAARRGDARSLRALMALLEEAEVSHPGGVDRRHMGR
ncbi:MAG: hypothetical protein K9H25_22675 [Rhodospirillum sp.]|nr:hypothetical protein [Rhodospirillum sp.]MCF8491910.1 hypothetical protein [Rhodospirillum sp.]MCF8502283.1 hypothetical protein [Rhodospirillum sp.]